MTMLYPNLSYNEMFYKWATTYDFQQCGILTSVDSDKSVQPPFSLETPNGVQSIA